MLYLSPFGKLISEFSQFSVFLRLLCTNESVTMKFFEDCFCVIIHKKSQTWASGNHKPPPALRIQPHHPCAEQETEILMVWLRLPFKPFLKHSWSGWTTFQWHHWLVLETQVAISTKMPVFYSICFTVDSLSLFLFQNFVGSFSAHAPLSSGLHKTLTTFFGQSC